MKKMLFLFIVVLFLNIISCPTPTIDEYTSIVLKASNVTEMSVDLSWTKIDGAYEYLVFVADTASEEGEIFIGTHENVLILEPLLPSKTYYITVKESNDDSESNFGKISNTISITTKAVTLEIPTNIVSDNNSFQIKFTWDVVIGADQYNIYRSESLDGEYLLLSWGKLDNTEYEEPENLEPDTEFYYKIQAVDSVNKKSSNLTPAFLSKTSPADYILPEILTFTKTAYSLSLSWVDDINAEWYDVEIEYDNGNSSYCVSSNSIEIEDLLPDKNYTVNIRAIDYAKGESSGTVSRAFKTQKATLAIPQGLIVTGTTGDSISVSWDAVTNANSYQIWISSDSTNESDFYLRETSPTTDCVLNSLNSDTTYYIKIRAINTTSSKCSNLSNYITEKTD